MMILSSHKRTKADLIVSLLWFAEKSEGKKIWPLPNCSTEDLMYA